MDYTALANDEVLNITVKSLEEKGYSVFVVEKKYQALAKIIKIIPKGASVINGTSVSLETIGYINYLKESKSGWVDLHAEVNKESDPVKRSTLRKKASVSDFYLGSVHALTTDGQMLIASNTGSQIPSIAFNSSNLIFVIGTQKIVMDLETGIKRLEDYVYPLENKHMVEKYGVGSNISKILIFRKENVILGRKINVILVKEKLGF